MFSKEEIKARAVIRDEFLDGHSPKGVILELHGLNCTKIPDEVTGEQLCWARDGWLIVSPLCGPWSWMNRETREYIDRLLDAVYEDYHLPANLPLILYGWSMGGYAALLYATYTRRTVYKCILKYPVCDLEYHYSERPDVPPTMQAAFWADFTSFEELWDQQDTLRRAKYLPRVPYLFFHSFDDTKVSKPGHSDRLVAWMRENDYDVTYLEVSGYDHHAPLKQKDIDAIACFL